MTSDRSSLNQIKRLTGALIISVGVNIILIVLSCYWVLRERPPTPYCESRPATKEEQQRPLALERSNSDLIRQFRLMSMRQLVNKLHNTELVENGYTQRDLALGSLVTFYHFDLKRALAGLPMPKEQKTIVFGKKQTKIPSEITVYPGLTASQFQAIIRFAQAEQWPLTSKGLFLALQKQPKVHDLSLDEAFYLTPEFLSVELLFNRSGASLPKDVLLGLILEGDWDQLSAFTEQQKMVQDLSVARRQRFILDYVEKGSKEAAYLILKTDKQFVVKKLDDRHILQLLKLMDKPTPEAEELAIALLTSPRRDDVWKAAALRLYDYAGEQKPEVIQHEAALARFVPFMKQEKQTAPLIVKPVPVPKPSRAPLALKREKIYVVREGDSLWKIGRIHKVDVEALKKANNLEKDTLKPGTTLRIP